MIEPVSEHTATGKNTLHDRYSVYLKMNLTIDIKITDNLYLSHIQDLSLDEFVVARRAYCQRTHNKLNCSQCMPLIKFAVEIIEHSVVLLSVCFRKCFNSAYKSDKAIRRIVQLPVAVFRVNEKLFVTEFTPNMNYEKFTELYSLLVPETVMQKGISKESLKMLCDLSSSEKDKKLIRVAATAHLSAKKAKKELGISDLARERKAVSDAIEDIQDIRDAVDEVVRVKEKLTLQELGIVFSEGEDDSPDEEMYTDTTLPVAGSDSESEIVTDSESDNPEDWVPLRGKPLYSEEVKAKIKKQHAIFYRLRKRRVAKIVSSKCLLQRKTPPRVSKTVKKYPDIGKVIEDFARERRIGADSWRRTGLLTFSGHTKHGPKLTYRRIKAHLEEKYGTKFAYGTVVQLCSVHNKRKLSRKRYWGAAQIVSRRARKGFNVKLNVDAKWSSSMYKILDYVQLRHGLDKVVINRDDAAGFRLDSTFTHKQHPILQDKSTPELTTRTDFLNRYSSNLQVTSYLLMETQNTPVACVGVVKPQKIIPKNPGQHSADLKKLGSFIEVKPLLEGKKIECIRVDGAMDENPSLAEVQFQWTERHLQQGTLCTMVSARYSGGSYLNKVELQNGCLAIGHSNLFVPSTIHGSNMDADGKLCHDMLKKNLNAATDVYINTVNGAPCFGTQIHLVKGATDNVSDMYQERRPRLLTFLRGSKKEIKRLQQSHPDDYSYFSKIWKVRERHMVVELPTNYLFMLLPCYQAECSHPQCQKGKPAIEAKWYPGGPPLSFLPLPIKDLKQPWGGSCDKCTGVCSGHYLKPEEHINWIREYGTDACEKVPPRAKIEQFVKTGDKVVQEDIDELSKLNLLSREDTEICVEHFVSIFERRKRNNEKRRKNKQRADSETEKQDVYCICRKEEEGLMIQCDGCEEWFHSICVYVTQEEADEMEEYICALCLEDVVEQ